MKIAIISDTHENFPAVTWIIDYLNQHEILTALHAGDIISPPLLNQFVEHYRGDLHFVFGNNDGEQVKLAQIADEQEKLTCYKNEMRLELLHKKIYMTHYSATSEDMVHSGMFDICVGGHDHQFRVKEVNGCLFINPGSTALQEAGHSFVVLDMASMKWEKVVVTA